MPKSVRQLRREQRIGQAYAGPAAPVQPRNNHEPLPSFQDRMLELETQRNRLLTTLRMTTAGLAHVLKNKGELSRAHRTALRKAYNVAMDEIAKFTGE